MGKRGAAAIVGATAAIVLTAAPGASAATEVGSRCGADTVTPTGSSVTVVQFSKGPSDPLPILVPAAGVLTEWKLQLVQDTAASFPVKLKVMRGVEATGVIVADSEGAVKKGGNAFATRIPVQAKDRFGLFAAAGNSMLNCETKNGADVTAPAFGEAAVGSTYELKPLFNSGYQVPITAVIEPDADGDEFGDETQDKCPQQVGSQAGCPAVAAIGPPAPIALDAEPVARKGSLLILVSVSSEASVSVSGAVKAAGRKRSRTLTLPALAQTVGPGQLGRFRLPFSKALKNSLAALPRGRSLKATIQVRATIAAGPTSERGLTARLPAPPR